ncbi:MAG TPA: hypothetical protein VF588_05490 [Pyrinomonadaceae bacterium]|jgi:hypothetical protein
MRNRHKATLVLFASLLCVAAAATGVRAQDVGFGGRAGEPYTAVVKAGEARFTLPAPQRPEWRWHRSETKENAREYMLSVKVVNEGQEYTFGFFLWKFPGARPQSGNLSSLIEAGQESLFVRAPNGHNGIVRDAGVKVRRDGDRVVITVKGRKNVARLFSGRPAEVKIETQILDEPPASQTVPVVYEN